ncbi:EVE domain-containing protein [Aestuariibacter halophilus]|uniref:EVE domain-containing protein n=1 Tax=Fluctibacter halophilus TaxID=226011 RepID=A0ABS8GBQ1_9ALTE|nr:EVE domain-containing protein [Aestuariibacter halophilus]MCC2617496.1 EVE domain-containing protein [Aestuariibacter halophilus]
MGYWLFKSEPDAFSIDDLAAAQTEPWDGIRNYQARNFLRDEVKVGDLVFIYHSSCKHVGIAGLAEVVKAGYPDDSQFDPESKYYDPKASPDNPRWYRVDVGFKQKFAQILPLSAIKQMPDIQQLGLVKKGHRLSIMPVDEKEFARLLAACQADGASASAEV